MLKVALVKRRDGFQLRARFEVPTPGVVALFGRSGCGKSTLVDLMSGLLSPDDGFVQLEETVLTDTRSGVAVPPEQRQIGYVFQDARLFPHFTVLGNLQYGLKRAARRQRAAEPPRPAGAPAIAVDEVVSLLGLNALLARRPHQLSGGERQRVALGRALLSQPRLLLLDEPLAALDVARRDEVLPYLEALRDRLSIPMVYVSHQFDEVLRLATHVVLMESGSVIAQGSLNEVSLTRELRDIVGPDAVGAVLEGEIVDADTRQSTADVRLSSGVLHVSLREARVGARLRVQLLARDIILATERPHALSVRNILQGTVSDLADDRHTDAVIVSVNLGDATVLSRVTRRAVTELRLATGTPVWVLVKEVSTRGHAIQVGGSTA
ncbi:MAG TPA: molybdenum ABC transporter ATP-binding protein [Steroidobacteraceae bacterium]|jgi:molybdate transport system ATP-binding protein